MGKFDHIQYNKQNQNYFIFYSQQIIYPILSHINLFLFGSHLMKGIIFLFLDYLVVCI